jgi:hypothetical protein
MPEVYAGEVGLLRTLFDLTDLDSDSVPEAILYKLHSYCNMCPVCAVHGGPNIAIAPGPLISRYFTTFFLIWLF